eukprot:750844-Rhodomonas_salina.1
MRSRCHWGVYGKEGPEGGWGGGGPVAGAGGGGAGPRRGQRGPPCISAHAARTRSRGQPEQELAPPRAQGGGTSSSNVKAADLAAIAS